MRKNVASQVVAAQLVSKTDGSAVTSGTTTVYVTVDGGTQATTSTATHEGNGCWTYAPSQAETNGNHVAYTFVNSSAVSATVNVYPVAYDPTDTVRMGLTALPNTAVTTNGSLITSGTGSAQLSVASGLVTLAAVTHTGAVIPTVTTVGTLTTYTGNTPQTGDSFARIGATGSGLTSLAASATALSTAQWTNTLATNLGTTNTTVATNLDAAVSSRGTSTLTQTQVTGGAYAINSASFAFNAALDFTTTQKAATLARVTLVDTTTTNTDMRGTNGAMLAYTQPTGFLAATFPATVASTTNITAGTMTTVTNLTNAPTAGDLTATMKASVNAEVLDVLNTDTFAQPTGVPTGTESLVNKIGRVHQALISELSVTATALTFFSFGGAALWKKTVADSGTTYSETDATSP